MKIVYNYNTTTTFIRTLTPFFYCGNMRRYLFNAKELDEESGMYYYSARYYAPPVFTSRDPLFEKYPWISPYAYCANNPLKYIDPTGMLYTDFVNSETGDCMHIDDGKDQVVIINNSDYKTISNMNQTQYSNMSSTQQSSYNQILNGGEKIEMNSTLGKTIRAVYAEMGNIGSSQEDRNIVAASVATRLGREKSNNIDNVLVANQYNAVSTDTYKNGPYSRESQIAEKAPAFYKANQQKLDGIRTGSISAAYKALNGLLPSAYDNVHSFVSPPRTSTHFDGNTRLNNVTNTFNGLKGVSGVWKIR
jgi:RHS repeat-associated protein